MRLSRTCRRRPGSKRAELGDSGRASHRNSIPRCRALGSSSHPQPIEKGGDLDVDQRELEPSRVDSAEVEDVIDDGEQGLGGFQGAVEKGPLLGIEGRLAQQPRHADNTIHGLADLVTHHREEVRARYARPLGITQAAMELGQDYARPPPDFSSRQSQSMGATSKLPAARLTGRTKP